MQPPNGQGIPLIGADQNTMAQQAQKVVEVTGSLKNASAALAKQGSHGQIVFSFFRDGSFSTATLGAIALPHLVSAAGELNQQVARAMQVALQQIVDQQRAIAIANAAGVPKA